MKIAVTYDNGQIFQHLGGCDFVQLSDKKRACEKIYQ